MPCYVIGFNKYTNESDNYLRILDRLGNIIKYDFRLNPLNQIYIENSKIITFPTCNDTLGSVCFTVIYLEYMAPGMAVKFSSFDFMGNIILSQCDIVIK